eukprot:2679256-Alexandrium_andersonii.AAC.1
MAAPTVVKRFQLRIETQVGGAHPPAVLRGCLSARLTGADANGVVAPLCEGRPATAWLVL